MVYHMNPHRNGVLTTDQREDPPLSHSNKDTSEDIVIGYILLDTLDKTMSVLDRGTVEEREMSSFGRLPRPTDGYIVNGIHNNNCYNSKPNKHNRRKEEERGDQ